MSPAKHWSDLTKNPNSATALDYRRAYLERARGAPILDRAQHLSSIASGRRVIDVGVADHDWTGDQNFGLHRRLAASASAIVGVDILPEAISALTREGFDAVVADVCSDDFAEFVGVGWEVVIAGEVIEHVGNPEALMRNCSRVLAPGGRLVLTTPNPYCLRLVAANLRGRVVENVDHLVYWFPSGFAELADRTGFTLVSYRGVISEVTGSWLRRGISRLASRTVLASEAACWTMVYELEAAGRNP